MTWHIETERKFLLKKLPLLISEGEKILQSYIFIDNQKEARVRISKGKATLAIKINSDDISRKEFEIPLCEKDALEFINYYCSKPPIEKTRYVIFLEGMKWEIDIFEKQNKGLILAEIELDYPEQKFNIPHWLEREVTYNRCYYNSYLYNHPFINWES